MSAKRIKKLLPKNESHQTFRPFLSLLLVTTLLMPTTFVWAAPDIKGVASKDTSGTYTRTDSYFFKKSSNNESNPFEMLALFAVGMVGTKLLTYKKKTYDMYVATGASGIYLMGEVQNLTQSKKNIQALEAKITLRADGVVDSAQVEYLKTLRESYQVVQTSLKNRERLQKTAMLGFVAAGAVATTQFIRDEGRRQSCEIALDQAEAELKTCTADGTATSVIPCKNSLVLVESIKQNLAKDKIDKIKIVPSSEIIAKTAKNEEQFKVTVDQFADITQARELIAASCAPYFSDVDFTKAGGVVAEAVTTSFKEDNNFYSPLKWINLFVAEAQASTGSLLSLLGGAATTLLFMSKKMSRYVDNYIFNPKHRIYIWGGFAALTALAISTTKSQQNATENNIKKIDGILADMDKLKQGVQASQAAKNGMAINRSIDLTSGDLKVSEGAKMVGCLSPMVGGNCGSLEANSAQALNANQISSSLATLSTTLMKTADTLSSKGSLSSAEVKKLDELNGKSNAILKSVNDQQDKFLSLNKSIPNPNVALKSEEMKNQLSKIASDELGKKPFLADRILASVGATEAVNSKNPLDQMKSKNEAVNYQNKSSGGESHLIADEKKSEIEMQDGLGKEVEKMPILNIEEEGLTKDHTTSIFEIISARYLKTGYRKLLDEK